jgi:hypothetical protein
MEKLIVLRMIFLLFRFNWISFLVRVPLSSIPKLKIIFFIISKKSRVLNDGLIVFFDDGFMSIGIRIFCTRFGLS